MKMIKYLSLVPLAMLSVGVAQAKGEIFYNAPFHNVEVKPASKIYVNYAFASHAMTLVCESDSPHDAIDSVAWQYKGVTRKIGMPVTLKDDARFKGYWADPQGKAVIANEFGASKNDGSIYVSCEYRNVN